MTHNIFTLNGGLVIISSNLNNNNINPNSNNKSFNSFRWYHSEDEFKWYQSIRTKLFICFFCITFIPLILFAFTMKNTLHQYFKSIAQQDLLYQASKIAIMIEEGEYLESASKLALLDQELLNKSAEENFRILIFDEQSVVLHDSNLIQSGKTVILPEVINTLQGQNGTTFDEKQNTIYASSYIGVSKEDTIGAVLLVSSFGSTQNLIDDISQKWMLLTTIVSIITGIFIFFASQVVISPINQILKSIKEIGSGQLHQRVKITGNNEIAQLGKAFNEMTETLEQIENSRQEFVSNVSHELKTPLSSIKVLSDSILLQDDMPQQMYIEFLQDITSEVDRMTDIVNSLLSLVKLDHGEAERALIINEIDLTKLLEDITKRLTPLAEQKGVGLVCDYLKPLVVEADDMKLSLAISNIIENAIKYTKEGSVSVILDGDHQNAFITIIDTGIGINEEEQSKIFNRFYRVDKTRNRDTGGTGLGLSITHSTIMLHKGSIKISSKEEEGSTFVVRVPIKSSINNNKDLENI